MELIVSVTIIILYFLFSFGKKSLEKLLPFKICNICTSVSLTWIGLLTAKYSGVFEVDDVLLGVLTGTSIGGIMYQMERFLNSKNIPNIWFARISEIILGVLFAYYLITERWDNLMLVALSILLITVIFFIISKNQGSSRKPDAHGGIAQLKQKLENCCD